VKKAPLLCCTTVHADTVSAHPLHGEGVEKDAFFAPTVLLCRDPQCNESVHDVEAFVPVSTLMPVEESDEALALAAKGQGSLMGTLVTRDPSVAAVASWPIYSWDGCQARRIAAFARPKDGKSMWPHGVAAASYALVLPRFLLWVSAKCPPSLPAMITGFSKTWFATHWDAPPVPCVERGHGRETERLQHAGCGGVSVADNHIKDLNKLCHAAVT
jgi:hypothetical protein